MIDIGNQLMEHFRVDILGENFELKSDVSEDDVYEIVRYVDEKMRQAVSEGKSTSKEKAAILAALNIAEEFFKEKKESDKTGKMVKEKSERLIELINSEVS